MAHRLGSGKKVEDLTTAQQEWISQGRSPSTYCSQAEYNAWQDNLGELMTTLPDGREIRRHASIKAKARGGSPKIVHNRVIVGNPKAYREWLAEDEATRPNWMFEWTYYPDNFFDRIVEQLTKS